MPFYDRVLGHAFDGSRILDPRAQRDAEQRLELVLHAEDASASNRRKYIEELAKIPGVKLELALENEERGRCLVTISEGRVDHTPIVDSRAADRYEPPAGEFLPVATVRPGVELDDVIDALQVATDDPIEPLDDEERSFELPIEWHGRDLMLKQLAAVAALLENQPVMLLSEVDGERYDVTVTRSRIRCVPVHMIAEEAELAARFRELSRIAAPSDSDACEIAVEPKKTRPKTPKLDPERPYTTGSRWQREDAVYAAQKKGSKAIESLAAAVRDPANFEPRYEEIRKTIYRQIAKYESDVVRDTLLWALEQESDSVISTVTYVIWQQTALLAQLPMLAKEAEANGDARTAARMRRAIREAQ